MKTLLIAAVAWAATIRTFVDGDIFRESQIDLMAGDIADRLGYLKGQLDGKAGLASDNAYTGGQLFTTSPGNGFGVTGTENVVLSGAVGLVGTFASFSGAVVSNDTALGLQALKLTSHGKVLFSSIATLPDADATIAATVNNIATLTANHAYDLPGGGGDDGRLIMVRRSGTAMYTATVRDPAGAVVCGVIPAGGQGWIVCQFRQASGDWVPVLWSGNVTNIRATV